MFGLLYSLVLAFYGVGVDLNNLVLQVDYPIFGYACFGIEPPFHASVISDGAIGYLYDQQHVRGCWGRLWGEVGARPQQRNIRLRPGVGANQDGALHPQDGRFLYQGGQQHDQIGNPKAVPWPDWWHIYNLSSDKLDVIVLLEDASLYHAPVFFEGE